MVKGRTLLGYDDKPSSKHKKLKYSGWLTLIISLSPIWISLLVALTIVVCVLFFSLVIAFTVLGFGAVMLLVYSAFLLMDELWPSIIKMGISLFTSGIVVIFIAVLFKGIKIFFKSLKNGYTSTKNKLLIKKLEDQQYEQNT